jgi:hypothetical protein
VIDHAGDRFTTKTGYSQMDGIKSCVKDRFRMGRSGTPDPKQAPKPYAQTRHFNRLRGLVHNIEKLAGCDLKKRRRRLAVV